MALFALECVNPGHQRVLEATLLSNKLSVARTGQAGVTHVLVDRTIRPHEFDNSYPGAEFVTVALGDLRGLPERLRLLGTSTVQTAVPALLGVSPQIEAVRRTIASVAPSDITVLITGETGCGKECAAQLVHKLSRRGAKPLVALNCAAIPDTMLEGELFGYEKGAFTGAIKSYPGKVKLADGGTLALDEVGDLSPQGQAKILRAIETHEFYRLGALKPDTFDARIVAMTNIDLKTAYANNTFRKDLYYRLAVAQVHLPPLRDRPEDILVLARHFLAVSRHDIADDAADLLQSHDWPGNVRELRNALQLAALQVQSGLIRADAFSMILGSAGPRHVTSRPHSERQKLIEALKAAGGNKSIAAKSLNWSRMTLYRKLEMHHLASSRSDVTSHVTL
jgi:DNA-binding NtrC family response regulator